MARPRKTLEQKKALGTIRKCREVNSTELQKLSTIEGSALTPLTTATPPKYLNKEGRKIFNDKVKQLTSLEVLTILDYESLALYAKSMEVYLAACDELEKKGFVVQTTKGPKPNPTLKVMNDMLSMVIKLGNQFGFTPSSRSTLAGVFVQQKEDKDEFSDFD